MKKHILPLLIAGMLVLQNQAVVFASDVADAGTETIAIETETVAAETPVAEMAADVPESPVEEADADVAGTSAEEVAAMEATTIEAEPEVTEAVTTGEESEAAEAIIIEEEPENAGSDLEAEEAVQTEYVLGAEAEPDNAETVVAEQFFSDEITILEIETLDASAMETLNASAIQSGTCGTDVTWTLNSDGVLTISGTGAMDDYEVKETATWNRPGYYDCRSKVMSIVIGEGITRIGAYAFQSLSSATSVTFPSTVTSIGQGAFYECSGLTSVEVPESVTDLEGGIFNSCYGLQMAVLPSHLTEIPGAMFSGCRELYYIKIPDGVTSIGHTAFQGTALSSVKLPSGLTTIQQDAFDGATLTSVVLPASVTRIGAGAFSDCSNLETVYFYGDCPTIEGAQFYKNGVTVYYLPGRSGWTEENIQKMAANGYTVNWQKWNAVTSGSCGTDVTWTFDSSSGVLTISGSGAMADYNFETYDSDRPWLEIEEGILKVVVNGGVTHIGDYVFEGLTNLKEAIIEDGVASIGEHAFLNCGKLNSITIPETVTEIGNNCFRSCKRLETVKLPSQIKNIDEWLFFEAGLKRIEIPAAVESIGECAFYYCEELTEITFAGSSRLTAVGESAFYHTAIREICLPDTVTVMGKHLFYGCKNLSAVKLPSGLPAVPALAFGYCESLRQIELPSTVTSIGEGSFGYSGLSSITIPEAVTKIGAYTFKECAALSDVYFKGTLPAVSTVFEYDKTANAYAFSGTAANIHYPYGGTGWSETAPADWGGTLTMIPEGVAGGACGTNVKWTLGQSGDMLISGSGDMADYTADYMADDTANAAPWDSVKNDIVKVTISDGVTGIGDNAFRKCDNLAEVKIGNSVTKIGNSSFGYCRALTEVTIPKSVVTVGKEAFRDCNLTTVLFLGNRPEAGENAFAVPPENTVKMQYHEGRTGWTDANIISLGDVPIDMGYDRTNYEFSMQRHNWQNATHSKDATCTALAERTYTCSVCQAAKTEKYGSLKAHIAGSWITTKSATCTGSGTRIQNCTACKVQVNQQTISALGHSFGGWTVTKEATVFAPRQEKRTCSRCKKVETRSTGSALKPTIKLNVTSIPLKVKQSTSVVKVSGLQKGDYVKSWKSNKTSVATVNKNGKITGKKRGTAKITVTLASGKKATVTVKVQLTTVLGKSITKTGSTKIKLERKAKYNLVKEKNLAVYPLTAKQKMTFYSSNTKVAKVNSKGVITAVGGGTAKITVRSGLAKKLTFTVTVPKIRTTAISGLIPNLIFQKRGMTDQLEPVITPKNSDDKVTYKSSNKKVVTVSSSGKLKAKKKGKAVITVQSGNIKYKINVIVQR